MNALHHDLVYALLPEYRRELDEKLIAARHGGSRASRRPVLTALNRLTTRRSRRTFQ